ncbi:MAG: N-acetylmuramoyl-L-alanine amidase [Cyclonatronaceae bacterium]
MNKTIICSLNRKELRPAGTITLPGAITLWAIIATLLLMTAPAGKAQVTGLSDWSLYVDPGHSRTENMGLYNFSEAEKNLDIALVIRDMLQEQTDIGEVHLSRTDQQQLVSLSERTTHANNTGSDFYYSIHSDAGSPSANSTLMLYGGWRQDGQTVEKTPKGGKLFGDIMDDVLTDAMRIGRRGNFADRTFYQGFPENHDNQWPYLHVNRTTSMASLLSEAGFHTNPTQQMRNVNPEWRRLEAQAAFWTIMDFHELERPEVGIVTGLITDSQSGRTIDGAVVMIGSDTLYVTDSFESRFHKYTSDPDEMSNGFYYLDGLEPGSTLDITFDSPVHFPKTVSVTLETQDFTFQDIELESSEGPQVVDIATYTPVNALVPGDAIEITFSRIPDKDTFEGAISFTPEAPFTYSWKDEYTLVITTDSLDFETAYELTITDQVLDRENGNAMDGNADGEPGGDYVVTIITDVPDTDPPVLVTSYPKPEEPTSSLRPVIRLVYDETVDAGSLIRDAVHLTGPLNGSGGSTAQEEIVRGTVQLSTVGRQSVLHFFPESELQNNAEYRVQIQSDLADRFGNSTEAYSYTFKTDVPEVLAQAGIDNFNSGISGWWVPQQSGSTAGIVTEETEREHETEIVNFASESTGSMRLSYGWDTEVSSHLIRLYLPPTADQNRRFSLDHVVQAYVFGDGSGNRLRFMLRDGGNQLEGSEWYTIDWIGWKLVEWNLQEDPVVGWVNGDGILSGQLYTDSFQMTSGEGDYAPSGTIYIDDYKIVQYDREPTSAPDPVADLPQQFKLEQNYPNPFNPTTLIGYELPVNSEVSLEVFDMLGRRVAVLVDGMVEAGSHQVSFDAARLSSGVYIYKLKAGSQTITRKMTLVK